MSWLLRNGDIVSMKRTMKWLGIIIINIIIIKSERHDNVIV